MELLAEHGPDGFSSRDVAKAAGVSYGLIHYYFGNRTELLRQAIAAEVEVYHRSTPAIEEEDWVPFLLSSPMPDRAWRALVQIALHWEEYGDLVAEFPIIRRRLDLLSARRQDIDLAHMKAALVASGCLQIGWLAAAPWYLASIDASADERVVIDEMLVEIERSILDVAIRMSAQRR